MQPEKTAGRRKATESQMEMTASKYSKKAGKAPTSQGTDYGQAASAGESPAQDVAQNASDEWLLTQAQAGRAQAHDIGNSRTTAGVRPQAPSLNNYSSADNTERMINDVLGTELVIEKCIRAMKEKEGPEQNWPIDTVINGDLVQSLSYTKMKNEINHRAPRRFSAAGIIEPIPLDATTGWHSASAKRRESDIEDQVGLGVSLYFKLLKYIVCLFFIFFVLSIFPMIIYFSGDAYDSEQHQAQKWLSITSLGSLGDYKQTVCVGVDLPGVANIATNIPFSCKKGRILKSIVHFGLASE